MPAPLYAGRGRHGCPRKGCTETIPDALFCCWRDWEALPLYVRREIGRTANQNLLSADRRAAVHAAMTAWGRL